MKNLDFPHCCTAKIIVDFGESAVAAGGNRPVTVDEITKYLQKTITSYKGYGYAMLVATTNTQQKSANKALANAGFEHTTWMKKTAHPETRVRLWWKQLNE